MLRIQLHAAVLADPSRDNCAVYGDHLQSLGDPRGELIGLDLALQRRLSAEQRETATRRREQLISERGGTWWPWLPPAKDGGPRQIHTCHGFVRRATLEVQRLPELGNCLVGEPVQRVTLSGVDGRLPRSYLRASWLRRLPWLSIVSRMSFEGLHELLVRRPLPVLSRLLLTLRGAGAHDGSLPDGVLPALEHLELVSTAYLPGGVNPRLLAWPVLRRLRSLRLAGVVVNHVDMEAFVAADFPQLEVLHFDHLNVALLRLLCAAGASFPALRRLTLYAGTPFLPMLHDLVDAPFPRLRELRVHGATGDLTRLRERYEVTTS